MNNLINLTSKSYTMPREASPHLPWNSSSVSTVTWSDTISHCSTLATAVSHMHSSIATNATATDLTLVCEGRDIPVHRLVVAASSPYLARLVTEADNSSPICLVGLKYNQAVMVVKFMYRGMLERVSEEEIENLLESTKHLQITGLHNGRTVIIKTEVETEGDPAMEDDDVFTDIDHQLENDHAVDLSPVNRHPPTPIFSGNIHLASRRMTTLNKISQALQRSSGSCNSKSSSSNDSRMRSSSSAESRSSYDSYRDNHASQEKFLNRIKKPKPLTNLPKHDQDASIYLKPKTPRTPLLASPDCQLLEEKFRNLIESNTTDPEKLRNLSVSSADFNFEAGGSLPSTPHRGPHRAFNFPPSSLGTQAQSGTLDLSIKKIDSDSDSDREPPCLSANVEIPTINVIKPEPEDSTESDTYSGHYGRDPSYTQSRPIDSPSYQATYPVTKQSPPYNHAVSPVNYPSDSQPSPSVKSEPGGSTFFFPQFPLPLSYSSSPHLSSAYLSPSSPGLDPSSNYKLLLPHGPFPQTHSGQGQPKSTPVGSRKKEQNPNKQTFKCQKCGKCYNWNYNLNRHMRFECGIENRFACSMCQKRFPYKQNAAIHLKRKHKLPMDNADDMLAQGHITLLPLEKNEDK